MRSFFCVALTLAAVAAVPAPSEACGRGRRLVRCLTAPVRWIRDRGSHGAGGGGCEASAAGSCGPSGCPAGPAAPLQDAAAAPR